MERLLNKLFSVYVIQNWGFTMKKNIESQKGLTFISILVILMVVGFFVLLLLKVGPIYMDNLKVKDTLASLETEADLTSHSKAKVKDLLDKRLNINAITSVSNEDITIVKKPGYVSIEIDYEVTENIIGNLDVLVYFNEVIEKDTN